VGDFKVSKVASVHIEVETQGLLCLRNAATPMVWLGEDELEYMIVFGEPIEKCKKDPFMAQQPGFEIPPWHELYVAPTVSTDDKKDMDTSD